MGIGGGETTDTLDPGLADNSAQFMANRLWGDTILAVTPDGQIEPRLAESYSSNADATVWTFRIREGVKFHDGSLLSVDDVIATFKRHSVEDSKSGALGSLKDISGIKADGQNVVFTLASGNADLPYLIGGYNLLMQPGGGVDNPVESRAELEQEKRAELYSRIAHLLWKEGGAVVPMFNDLIDAHNDAIAGWVPDPNFELMGGYAPLKTWMA